MGDKDDEDLNKVVVEGGVPHACAGMSLFTIMTDHPGYGPCSPYGMASILSSWKAGGGPDELKPHLNLEMVKISDDDLFNHFKIISKSFKSEANKSNFSLKCENRFFTRNCIKIKEKFAEIVKEKFDTEIIPCDLSHRKVYEDISEWSLGATDRKVDSIIPYRMLYETDFLLLNVVYFKGFWEQKFDPRNTFKGPFFLGNCHGRPSQVLYMKLENGHFLAGNYTSGDMKIDILSIPFKGNRLRLIIYMLDKNTDHDKFENILKVNRDYEIFIPSLLQNKVLKEKKVNLTFPKFKDTSFWALPSPLSEYVQEEEPAMTKLDKDKIFGHVCEDRCTEGEPTEQRIKILQKILVEFDEGQGQSQGSDQSQEVKKLAEKDGDSEPNLEFNVNRPFFYAIADTITDMMLIQGHCRWPTSYYDDDDDDD